MKHIDLDPEIAKLIALESKRQRDVLEMIPSENYVSPAVREAMGSIDHYTRFVYPPVKMSIWFKVQKM